jgi:hypothetical protein
MLFRCTLAALCLASLLPLWLVRYPPLFDWPNHVAAASAWAHYSDPAWHFARYYELRLGPVAYWTYYALVRGLTPLVGLFVADRLTLSLYVIALPIGMVLLARRFGRSEWLALLVFPVLWNWNLASGLIPFCLGMALLPFALVAFDRFCEQPTVARAALALATAIATFFSHLLPWGMWLGAAGLIGLLHRGLGWRTLALRLVVWLVPVVVAVWVMRYGGGYGMSGLGFAPHFVSLSHSLHEAQLYLLDAWVGREDDVLLLLWALVFIALKLTARRETLTLHGLRAEACVLVAVVAYFVLPRSVTRPSYWWGINVRFAALAWLFASLCVSGPIDVTRGWRRWLLVPAALLGFAFAGMTLVHWRRCDAWFGAREFDRLANEIPRDARTLVLGFGRGHNEPSSKRTFIERYPALLSAFWGGYYPSHFDQFPIGYRERFPAPSWQTPERFRWDYQAHWYDYVLVYAQPGLGSGQATLVDQAGPWQLWKTAQPRIDAPPAPPYPKGWADDPNWRPGMPVHD